MPLIRPLLPPLALLTALCLALIVSARVLGTLLPPPAGLGGLPGFGACALPCWAGIFPGITSFQTIPDRVQANAPGYDWQFLLDGNELRFASARNDPLLRGGVFYERGLAGELRLDIAIPLRRVVEDLGLPRCIHVSRPRTSPLYVVFLVWPLGSQQISALLLVDQNTRWGLDTPIRQVTSASGVDWCRGARPWSGLAPLWHYSLN